MAESTFQNPILSGFYPDPSICRVGEDYYLATSSFCYFPGIPIFHSRDLIHWEQLGHAIHRADQLDYSHSAHSEGLWAPTLRHHKGRFYLVNTMVRDGREAVRQNFIVTAENPAGPWSNPVIIQGADGIDPSLFFDDDGSIWYCGNFICPQKPYDGHHGLYLCRLDNETLQFAGERKVLWDGDDTHCKWLEAPHIYKVEGRYYLLAAEGGTFHNHSVVMARSDRIDGDYEVCRRNPILTHRQLSPEHPIAVTGHGDLVQTQSGEWWMVLLAVRPYEGGQFNLGRETFLVPMRWEQDGWLAVDNANGLVNEQERLPRLVPVRYPRPSPIDNFEETTLGLAWNRFRSMDGGTHSLTARPGFLRLYTRPAALGEDCTTPAFIGHRQQHKQIGGGTVMEFSPEGGEEAGLALVQSNEFHYLFTLKREGQGICLTLCAQRNIADFADCHYLGVALHREELHRVSLPDGCCRLYLWVEGGCESYRFYYGFTERERIAMGPPVDGTLLSTNVAGGFVGTYLGLYASANGEVSKNWADFDWFQYFWTE